MDAERIREAIKSLEPYDDNDYNKGKQSAKKRNVFAYSFRLIDLTKMAFGSSMKSEKEDRAMMFLRQLM